MHSSCEKYEFSAWLLRHLPCWREFGWPFIRDVGNAHGLLRQKCWADHPGKARPTHRRRCPEAYEDSNSEHTSPALNSLALDCDMHRVLLALGWVSLAIGTVFSQRLWFMIIAPWKDSAEHWNRRISLSAMLCCSYLDSRNPQFSVQSMGLIGGSSHTSNNEVVRSQESTVHRR